MRSKQNQNLAKDIARSTARDEAADFAGDGHDANLR